MNGFPETVSPGHWGGYDALAGSSFPQEAWLPVADGLTYLVGYALAETGHGSNWHLDRDGQLRLAETASGLLYRLRNPHGDAPAFSTLDGRDLALVLGAAEDCHFGSTPDEGFRDGCPTCEALLDVQLALGLEDTQWVEVRFAECRKHDDCEGCPLAGTPQCPDDDKETP